MKIKLFIVTYNAENELNQTLQSLFESDWNQSQEIIILNNYSKFLLQTEFINKVTVLHNQCRPDFSTGHLSRSWNQALIHGFKNLNQPDADIVITCQDDTIFSKTWFSELLFYHKKYTFISSGHGDNLCSYTADAVKNIGIWDERFCNIGYQEADYFLRAYLFNKNKSSINDDGHHRVWNPLPKPLVKRPYKGFMDRSLTSLPYHEISLKVFESKWPVTAAFWDEASFFEKANKISKPLINGYMLYPYFEKDINNLASKGYAITKF